MDNNWFTILCQCFLPGSVAIFYSYFLAAGVAMPPGWHFDVNVCFLLLIYMSSQRKMGNPPCKQENMVLHHSRLKLNKLKRGPLNNFVWPPTSVQQWAKFSPPVAIFVIFQNFKDQISSLSENARHKLFLFCFHSK